MIDGRQSASGSSTGGWRRLVTAEWLQGQPAIENRRGCVKKYMFPLFFLIYTQFTSPF
jgi:hypothetical protein